MPAQKIKGLRGLKGLDSLSTSQRKQWKEANAKYLGKYPTRKQQEELFNTQRFVAQFGKDLASQLTYDQRLQYEQGVLDDYNNDKIREFTKNWANPYNEDGTLNPNKGVGDATIFEQIMSLEPQHMKELVESDWKTPSELQAAIRKDNREHYNTYTDPRMMATEGGGANLASWLLIGEPANKVSKTGENKNIFDKILAKDVEVKAKNSKPTVDRVYQQITKTMPDEELVSNFMQTITPVKGVSTGIPALRAFFDDEGNARSSEAKHIEKDDMRRWIAKYQTYNALYGSSIAYDMLDKEARDYLHEHQSAGEYGNALFKDMIIGASAYTMDFANGVRAAWIRGNEKLGLYSTDKVDTYTDGKGNYYGSERLQKNNDGSVKEENGVYFYEDPYSKEVIPVKKTQARRSVLDAQGIASDGTTRGLLFNNQYWNDAEATGMFTREEQALAKSLNGYSPSKAVYKMGEDKDYVWEVVKMTQFAAADVTSMALPGLGSLGGAKLMASAAKNTGKAAKLAMISGRTLKGTSDIVMKTAPTRGAIGIAHAYGRNLYQDLLSQEVANVDNYVSKAEQEKFLMAYNSNAGYRQAIDAKVDSTVQNYIEKNQEAFNALSEEEKQRFVDNLIADTRIAVVQQEVEKRIDDRIYGQNPIYMSSYNRAAESAAEGASTAATTIGIKYAIVNNIGYRNFLFKDPFKKINTRASKILQGATEGSNKKFSIVEKFKKGVKGVTKRKIGNAAKVVGQQMWGGSWTNFTDEMQSEGGRAISEATMQEVLYGDEDWEKRKKEGPSKFYPFLDPRSRAQAASLGFFNSIGYYLQGGYDALFKDSTWNAGLVGGLGSITSLAPNIAAMTSGNFRKAWKDAYSRKAVGEMVNLIISNGVLNGYYESILGEREAAKVIEQVNTIVDNYGELKELGDVLTLDMADVTDEHTAKALEFIKAAMIMEQLRQFDSKDTDQLVLALSKRHSILAHALEQIDKISNYKFTDKEAKEYLVEYYAKNPSIPQSTANSQKAIDAIVQNARSLKTGMDIVNRVNKAIKDFEKELPYTIDKIPSLVYSRLVSRLALDQFLTDEITKNEEAISGDSSINTISNPLSRFTPEELMRANARITKEVESLEQEIKILEEEHEKKYDELSTYIEDREDEFTSEELKELDELKNDEQALTEEIESRKARIKELKEESEYNILNTYDTKEALEMNRVLSHEEILRLSPEDRARMLNEANLNKYSEAQQKEIKLAKEQLIKKDPNLMEAVQRQALLVQQSEANSAAYTKILENPLEASEILAAEELKRDALVREAIIANQASIIESLAKVVNNAMESQEVKDKVFYNQLLGLAMKLGYNSLEELKDYLITNVGTSFSSPNSDVMAFSHIFDQVIEKSKIIIDSQRVLDSLKLDSTLKGATVTLLNDLIKDVNNKQEFLDIVNKTIADTSNGEDSKVVLDKFLRKLENIWSLETSTAKVDTAALEKQAEEAKKLREEVEAAKKAAEKAAIGADKSTSESATEKSADLSNTDINEDKSKGEEEAIKEASISEEDKKVDKGKEEAEELAKVGSSKEGLDIDNESTVDTTQPKVKEVMDNGVKVKVFETLTAEEEIKGATEEEASLITITATKTLEKDNVINGIDYEGNLLGISLYRYDAKLIKGDGIQQVRQPSRPGDPLERVFKWLDNEGIRLQDIVDNELAAIAAFDPKIYPMFVPVVANATDDAALSEYPLLVVEYTPEMAKAKFHNEKFGGIINFNGKQYLTVGMLGFNSKRVLSEKEFKAQQGAFNKVLNTSPRKAYFDAHPGERFFVNINKYTKFKQILSGYRTKQLTTDSKIEIRSIVDLITDPERNPRKLKLEDLKWIIQRDNAGDFVTVNASKRNKIFYPSEGAGSPGSVYLLVETANGSYVPAYIRPVKLNEIPKDCALMKRIKGHLMELSSTDHARREAAVIELRKLLVLNKKGEQILVGIDSRPTVTLKRGDVQIRSTFQLNSDTFEGAEELARIIIEELNPRINVTQSNLSTSRSIKELSDAGALNTDIAKLGTSNASFQVYTIDENTGEPIIPITVEGSAPKVTVSSDLAKSQRTKNSIAKGKKTYRKDAETGKWRDEVENTITDEKLIEQLDNELLIRDRIHDTTVGQDKIYIISKDPNNPIVIFQRPSGRVERMLKEGAIKMIDKVAKETLQKEKQAAIEDEAKRLAAEKESFDNATEEQKKGGAEVDLGVEDSSKSSTKTEDESMSPQEILDQIIGQQASEEKQKEEEKERENKEQTPQQKTTDDLLTLAIQDSELLNLTDDELFYIDEKGDKWVRVTSATAADVRGERFDPTNPYALPSTTLGTGFHQFIEDVLFNKDGNPDNYTERYPNASNDDLKKLAEKVRAFKQKMEQERGLTLKGTEVKVSGTIKIIMPDKTEKLLPIAGSIDLLWYDRDGNVVIMDLKTKRSEPTQSDNNKWFLQQSLYKQMLEQKYGVVVSKLEILPIALFDETTRDNKYPKPAGKGGTAVYTVDKEGRLSMNGKAKEVTPLLGVDTITLDETTVTDTTPVTPLYEDLLAEEKKLVKSPVSKGKEKAIKLGLLREGESAGLIVHEEDGPNGEGRLNPLTAKLILVRVKSSLSLPSREGAKEHLHDALVSKTHGYKCPMPVLSFMYQVQEAIFNGQMTVEEAMDLVKEMLYIDKDAIPQEKTSTVETVEMSKAQQASIITKPYNFDSFERDVSSRLWEELEADAVHRQYSNIHYITGELYRGQIEPIIKLAIKAGVLSRKYSRYLNRTRENSIELEDLREIFEEFIKLGINSPKELVEFISINEGKTLGELFKIKENPSKNSIESIVQPEPIKAHEDINETGTKSLIELQAEKTYDNALAILKSKKYGDRVFDIIDRKFPDAPSNMTELLQFLQTKGIDIVNIRDVEDWIGMIENCK